MSFGDDYRNFIDCLSKSSMASMSLDRRQKRSKMMRKKMLPVRHNYQNTPSFIKLPYIIQQNKI